MPPFISSIKGKPLISELDEFPENSEGGGNFLKQMLFPIPKKLLYLNLQHSPALVGWLSGIATETLSPFVE